MKRFFCYVFAFVGLLAGFSSCTNMGGIDSSLKGDFVCQEVVVVMDGKTTSYSGEDLEKGVLSYVPFYYEIDFKTGGKCLIYVSKDDSTPDMVDYSIKDNYIYLAYSGMNMPLFKIKSNKGKTLALELAEMLMEASKFDILVEYDSELESVIATYQKK